MFRFHPTAVAIQYIRQAYTGHQLKGNVQRLGFNVQPKDLTGMYLRNESAEYIYAACVAVNQIGE